MDIATEMILMCPYSPEFPYRMYDINFTYRMFLNPCAQMDRIAEGLQINILKWGSCNLYVIAKL